MYTDSLLKYSIRCGKSDSQIVPGSQEALTKRHDTASIERSGSVQGTHLRGSSERQLITPSFHSDSAQSFIFTVHHLGLRGSGPIHHSLQLSIHSLQSKVAKPTFLVSHFSLSLSNSVDRYANFPPNSYFDMSGYHSRARVCAKKGKKAPAPAGKHPSQLNHMIFS